MVDCNSITRVSKSYKLPGFVLDKDIMLRINDLCIEAVSEQSNSTATSSDFEGWITVSGKDHRIEFNSSDSMFTYLDSAREKISNMEVNYKAIGKAGVSVSFDSEGTIELSAYGTSINFQLNVDKIERELKSCNQDISQPVRLIVFSKVTMPILIGAIVFFSLSILLSMNSYRHATQIGVNIDPKLVPKGNSYYQEVDKAIKSEDINYKLDTLLKARLIGFVNVDNYLNDKRKSIITDMICTGLALAMLIICWALRKVYPRAFFSFGSQVQVLAKHQRSREIWGVAVFVAFAVNIVAGFIVAFMTK